MNHFDLQDSPLTTFHNSSVRPDNKSNYTSRYTDTSANRHVQEYFSNQVFTDMEYQRPHNPYDQEIREYASIEHGDPEQLEASLTENYIGECGTLSRDPLRNSKNMGIVNITLASRAAIRGGLAPELAFSLSDAYILQIEECQDSDSVHTLMTSAKYQYARMVQERNKLRSSKASFSPNLYINQCKDYIASHLHDKITEKEIAEKLSINASYLSDLFHTYEKITLTQYIRLEKIKLAQNMLTYSPYTYSEIAAYLGFSSQSHLGKWFKEVTGMTMKEYRNKYKKLQ